MYKFGATKVPHFVGLMASFWGEGIYTHPTALGEVADLLVVARAFVRCMRLSPTPLNVRVYD